MSGLRKTFQTGANKYDFRQVQPKRRRCGPKDTSTASSSSTHLKTYSTPDESDSEIDDNSKETAKRKDPISLSCPNIGTMDDEEIYRFELMKNHGLIPTDQFFTAFLVQDFNISTKDLKANKYCVVKRKAILFKAGERWVWACSCSRHFLQYYEGLPYRIEENYIDFPNETCMHTEVVRSAVLQNDYMNDTMHDHIYPSSSVEKADVWEIQYNGEQRAVVTIDKTIGDNTIGVVKCVEGRLECLACTYGRDCCHVRKVKDMMSADTDVPDIIDILTIQLLKSQQLGTETVLKCLSRHPIEFIRNHPMPEPSVRSFQSEQSCPNCESVVGTTTTKDCLLFTNKGMLNCTVTSWECSECHTKTTFDGGNAGILNMDKFLIHHEVLRQYMYLFLHGRLAMYSFYCSWRCIQEDKGNNDFARLFPYRYFRMAWYSYLKMLDLQLEDGFHCKECGLTPDIILCDATSIGHRKIYQNWIERRFSSGKRGSGR